MAAGNASPPPITDGSIILFNSCLMQHSFDLDEALSLPADFARQVADSNSLVDTMPEAVIAPSGGVFCPICREELRSGVGGCRTVPCGHVFHAACISSWLSSSAGSSCPLCRRSICAG